ncbi:hypothetical protein AHAS_Ahas19G0374500 [Arachis hypogaea]
MEWNRATPPDSRSLHGKAPLGDKASRGFRGRYRHYTVVGKSVLVPCRVYLLETLTVLTRLEKFNTRMGKALHRIAVRRSTTATRSRRRRHLLGLPLRAPSSPSFIRVLPSLSRRRRYLDISMAIVDVEFRYFVGGLPWATDNEALEKAFSAYREIVESKVRLL